MDPIVMGPLAVVGLGFIATAAAKQLLPVSPVDEAERIEKASVAAAEEVEANIELDLSLASAIASEEGRAELKILFETLDKSGDGKVSSKEWGSAVAKHEELLSKYFGGTTKEMVGKQFSRLDADGSGDLSWEEFAGGALSLGAAIKIADAMETDEGAAELRTLFDSLDKDGDGKISSKEWASAVLKSQALVSNFFFGSSRALKEAGIGSDIVSEMTAAKKNMDAADAAVLAAEGSVSQAKASQMAATQVAAAAEEAFAAAEAAVPQSDQELQAAIQAATEAEGALGQAEEADKMVKPKAKNKAESKKAVESCQIAVKAAKAKVEAAQKYRDSQVATVGSKRAERDSALKAKVKAGEDFDSEVAEVGSKVAAAKAAKDSWEAFSAAEKQAVLEIAQVYKRLDVDKNGKLTWEEFTSGAASITDVRPAQAFAVMDRNGDGMLSRSEVVKALRTEQSVRDILGLGPTVKEGDGSKEQFEDVFQRLDKDGSKSITSTEFAAVLAQPINLQGPALIPSATGALDA
mmetsp:Transcript_4165/g.9078  ORF Transcript_4165/g.9078 Transcript_4165/m.9078 type:complete len:521 (-) Transcript_4165:436-1998(-)